MIHWSGGYSLEIIKTSMQRALLCNAAYQTTRPQALVLQNKLDLSKLEFYFLNFPCYHTGFLYAQKLET